MAKDPIVEEVRRIRQQYAARFNYDLAAIFRDLKERQHRGEFYRREPEAPTSCCETSHSKAPSGMRSNHRVEKAAVDRAYHPKR